MSKREKRLSRLRHNPKSVTFEELTQVLGDFGFNLKRSKGSHYIFEAIIAGIVWQFVVPYQKPHIKVVHVRKAIELLDEISIHLEAEEEKDE
jgi:predicted RNA binding protein YcfA (HicA-like mRNA interferase family)